MQSFRLLKKGLELTVAGHWRNGVAGNWKTIVIARPEPLQRPKAATIKTIALDLGLAISTVSRALQDDPAVRRQTRDRVNEAADRLGYKRNFRGVNLRTGKTFTLCALLASNPSPEFGDPASMHLIQGLIEGVAGSDFKVVIRPVEGLENQLSACCGAVIDGRFDGFILDHTEPQDLRIAYLLEHRIPFITFGRSDFSRDHAFFDIDNEQAAYVATRHLMGRGHDRIALIDSPSQFLFSSHRLGGYRRALAEAGIPYDPMLVAEMPITVRSVRDRVTTLMDLPHAPTGFVTANEVATIGTISATRTLAPERFNRLDFVSRDGTTLFDFMQPPVSSCYFPIFEAGRQLARGLVRVVSGTPADEIQTIETTRLVERT
jgi:LacI family transcriptional regulator